MTQVFINVASISWIYSRIYAAVRLGLGIIQRFECSTIPHGTSGFGTGSQTTKRNIVYK